MGLAWQPHGDSLFAQVLLEFANVVDAEVEDAGGKRGIGAALAKDVAEVRRVARSAGSDDGNRHCARDSGSEFAIEADASAVAIHGGQHDLTGTTILNFLRPLDGFPSGRFAAAGDEDFG